MQHGAPLETFSRLACQSEMALASKREVRERVPGHLEHLECGWQPKV